MSGQSTYLQAIKVRGDVDIFFGRYQRKSKKCRICHVTWDEYEEKMSDVRLATELLRDAFKNRFDTQPVAQITKLLNKTCAKCPGMQVKLKKSKSSPYQAISTTHFAFPLRHNFNRLCAPVINRHSLLTISSPRSIN